MNLGIADHIGLNLKHAISFYNPFYKLPKVNIHVNKLNELAYTFKIYSQEMPSIIWVS